MPPADLEPLRAAWGTDRFVPLLRQTLEQLPPGDLGLDRLTQQGGRVAEGSLSFALIRTMEDAQGYGALVTVYFDEIVSGCSCGDEPQAGPVQGRIELWIGRLGGQLSVRVRDPD